MRNKKIYRYKGGQAFVVTDAIGIMPNDIEPLAVDDISDATEEEVAQIRRNPHDQVLLAKIKERGLHKEKRHDV
jgi:hypothetical protein